MNEHNTIDSLHRSVPQDHDVIDLSLRGDESRWARTLEKQGILKRELGVQFVSNPNSPIILIAPHAQQGITTYDKKKVTESELVDGKQVPWNNTYPSSSIKIARLGKAVVYQKDGSYVPSKEDVKADSGMGDSLSKQFTFEIACSIALKTNADNIEASLPNMVMSTISQASLDANSGMGLIEYISNQGFQIDYETQQLLQSYEENQVTDITDVISNLEFKIANIDKTSKDYLLYSRILNNLRTYLEIKNLDGIEFGIDSKEIQRLSRKIIRSNDQGEIRNSKRNTAALTASRALQNYRGKVQTLALNQQKSTTPFILNVHTALDRNASKGGNPDLEIIIGSRRGLSCDPETEIQFALFLKSKGFNVLDTSLFPPSTEPEIDEVSGVAGKPALEGEEVSSQEFIKWATRNGITPDQFTRDTVIEEKGRLAGTSVMPNLRNSIKSKGINPNILQIEVTRGTL